MMFSLVNSFWYYKVKKVHYNFDKGSANVTSIDFWLSDRVKTFIFWGMINLLELSVHCFNDLKKVGSFMIIFSMKDWLLVN
jgi:hypothetical protein